MKKVLILGIDTFAAKNIAQVNALARKGYRFTIATSDTRADSHRYIEHLDTDLHQIHILSANPLSRSLQVLRLLKQGPYNHIELYAGGRFTMLYLPLLRYFRFSWIVVERGDIGSMDVHPYFTRKLVQRAYRAANAVWYKEPYMFPLLVRAGARKLYFIPNAAEVPSASTGPEYRDLDFLWANRLVHVRHPDWIVRAVAHNKLAQCTVAILGMQDDAQSDPGTRRLQAYVRLHKTDAITLHAFTDPMPWYERARFFLLPADLVFGNNALLEAMARGVVPIVTQSPGIEDLIIDGVNGFIADLDETSFQLAMLRAMQLNDEAWHAMSLAAVNTIRDKFNLGLWSCRMSRMYEELA